MSRNCKRGVSDSAVAIKPKSIEAWATLRKEYLGVLLLMRLGDFYETFDEDADIVASACYLPKTTCDGHRVVGFPCVQLECFLMILIQLDYRVAIAEEISDKPPPDKPVAIRASAPLEAN